MNPRQKMVLALGLAWALLALLFPPVLVPPAAMAGQTRPFVEFPFWPASALPATFGILMPRLIAELLAILLLTAVALRVLGRKPAR